jgi:AcrR family transcriptional regulator
VPPTSELTSGLDPAAPGRGRRASPLPSDERRRAIATATLPLLLEHGTNVTTRQIADAAGIAEGTIFRVFPDKDAVVRAAIDLAFDTSPTEQALGRINPALPLEQKLVEAVRIIQRRMADIGRLVSAVGGPAVFAGRERPLPDLGTLVALFEPERGRLAYDPARAARLLPALTLAFSHPALVGDDPMPAAEIVHLLLDGIRARPAPPAAPRREGPPAC